jgi:hypothetical protein
MEITCLSIQDDSIYTYGVIDWYSLAVLTWGLSNTLAPSLWLPAVYRAIAEKGA